MGKAIRSAACSCGGAQYQMLRQEAKILAVDFSRDGGSCSVDLNGQRFTCGTIKTNIRRRGGVGQRGTQGVRDSE